MTRRNVPESVKIIYKIHEDLKGMTDVLKIGGSSHFIKVRTIFGEFILFLIRDGDYNVYYAVSDAIEPVRASLSDEVTIKRFIINVIKKKYGDVYRLFAEKVMKAFDPSYAFTLQRRYNIIITSYNIVKDRWLYEDENVYHLSIRYRREGEKRERELDLYIGISFSLDHIIVNIFDIKIKSEEKRGTIIVTDNEEITCFLNKERTTSFNKKIYEYRCKCENCGKKFPLSLNRNTYIDICNFISNTIKRLLFFIDENNSEDKNNIIR